MSGVSNDMKNIVFFGHHKCGSRYFRKYILNRIGALTGRDVVGYQTSEKFITFNKLDELEYYGAPFDLLNPGPIILGLTNTSPRIVDAVRTVDSDYIGIHVVRDPRQILVSSYFHHLEGHPVEAPKWYWSKLDHDRKKLQSLSREEGLIYELENITDEILSEQIRPWENQSNTLELKLETFDSEIEEFSSKLSKDLGENIELQSSEAHHQENDRSQDWRAVFTPRLTDLFKERHNDLLLRWGYETDDRWQAG